MENKTDSMKTLCSEVTLDSTNNCQFHDILTNNEQALGILIAEMWLRAVTFKNNADVKEYL